MMARLTVRSSRSARRSGATLVVEGCEPLTVRLDTAGACSNGGTGGGLTYNSNGNPGALTITNSTFKNNVAHGGAGVGLGGGIFLSQALGTASVQTSTVTGNPAIQGGAIYVDSGTLNAASSRIVGNTASSGGGGIFNDGGTLTARDDWCGCNTGPNTAGCDSAGGMATTTTFALITLLANPGSVLPRGASTLTADMNHDSAAAVITPVLPGEFAVTFGGTLGSAASALPVQTVNRVAQSTWGDEGSGSELRPVPPLRCNEVGGILATAAQRLV